MTSVVQEPAHCQKAVYAELRALAADFYDYDWHSLAVTPRTNALICGASGGGKTFLCRLLARELEIPFLDLEYSNWIVTGASTRAGIHTLKGLYRFLDRNPRAVIAIDEVDKLGQDAHTDWTRSIHVELFSVLDRRVMPGIIENVDASEEAAFALPADEIQDRLRRGCFICAGGAWQHLWRRNRQAGFAGDQTAAPVQPSYHELLEAIRPEILNRFRGTLLFLPPLTSGQYDALLEEVISRLPPEFGPFMRSAATRSVAKAVDTQKGFRWVEELVADAVRALRIADEQAIHSTEASGEAVADEPSRCI